MMWKFYQNFFENSRHPTVYWWQWILDCDQRKFFLPLEFLAGSGKLHENVGNFFALQLPLEEFLPDFCKNKIVKWLNLGGYWDSTGTNNHIKQNFVSFKNLSIFLLWTKNWHLQSQFSKGREIQKNTLKYFYLISHLSGNRL